MPISPICRSLFVLALCAGAVLAAAVVSAQEPRVTVRAPLVIDGKGGVVRNATVVIDGSTIERVDASATGPATYDLAGLTLLPGFVDVHVHLDWHFGKDGRADNRGETPVEKMLFTLENAYETLMAGFTTVQCVGSPSDKALREAIARGMLPGPRVLTSLGAIEDDKMTPDQIRAFVRQKAADGADLIKIFASGSIRDGGEPTLSQEQLDAACGEANAHGLRTLVHAHSPESIRRSVEAGCTEIEHGIFADAATLKLMADRGVWFDPNIGLVLQNYLRNKARFLGIGNYTEEGFAYMEKAIPLNMAMFKQALATPGPEAGDGHRRRVGRRRAQRRRDHRARPGRPAGHGRHRGHDGRRGRVAADGRHDRLGLARASGRSRRRRGQPARRHHRAQAGGVRDEGREGLQKQEVMSHGMSHRMSHGKKPAARHLLTGFRSTPTPSSSTSTTSPGFMALVAPGVPV